MAGFLLLRLVTIKLSRQQQNYLALLICLISHHFKQNHRAWGKQSHPCYVDHLYPKNWWTFFHISPLLITKLCLNFPLIVFLPIYSLLNFSSFFHINNFSFSSPSIIFSPNCQKLYFIKIEKFGLMYRGFHEKDTHSCLWTQG